MEDKNMQKLLEQFLILEGQVSQLRASVFVLRGLAGVDLNPADPVEGLKQLQILEKKVLAADPNAQIRQEASEIIQALKAAKEKGGPHEA